MMKKNIKTQLKRAHSQKKFQFIAKFLQIFEIATSLIERVLPFKASNFSDHSELFH